MRAEDQVDQHDQVEVVTLVGASDEPIGFRVTERGRLVASGRVEPKRDGRLTLVQRARIGAWKARAFHHARVAGSRVRVVDTAARVVLIEWAEGADAPEVVA